MKTLIYKLLLLPLMLIVGQTIYYYRLPNSDLIYSVLLLIGLFFSLKKEETEIGFIIDYIFCICCVLISVASMQFLFLTVSSNLDAFLYKILLFKFILLIISYIKFRKFIIPTSVFNKLWIVSIFFTLIHSCLTSKHIYIFVYFFGTISSIDSLFTLLKMKKWKFDVKFFFNAN